MEKERERQGVREIERRQREEHVKREEEDAGRETRKGKQREGKEKKDTLSHFFLFSSPLTVAS